MDTTQGMSSSPTDARENFTSSSPSAEASAEVFANLKAYTPPLEAMFDFSAEQITQEGLAHLRCRTAANDFDGCLDILPPESESVERAINKMKTYAFSVSSLKPLTRMSVHHIQSHPCSKAISGG